MTTLTVRLPEALKTELNNISREESRTVSEIVRESLRRCVTLERFRSARKRVLPFAEAHGLFTDEDVFKAMS